MKGGSCIINTTSVNAYKGHKQLLDYTATKGAIVAFTRALALHLAEKGIRVNGVAPGPIWTPLIPSGLVHEGGGDGQLREGGADGPSGAADRGCAVVCLPRVDAGCFLHHRTSHPPQRYVHNITNYEFVLLTSKF